AAGTYRIRAEGDIFVPLEKEVVVRGAPPAPIEFALSAKPAPPPPPPPPPAPAPEPPPRPQQAAAPPGDPRLISITDLAERSLSGREPVKTIPIGCSGTAATQL